MPDQSFSKIIFENNFVSCDKPVESLPCFISYTGPAFVNSYFLTETLDISTDEELNRNIYGATFRGRILYGRKAFLPKKYKFYVAKRLPQNGHLNQQFFHIVNNSNIRLWDFHSNNNGCIQRSIDFLNIAEDFSQPDKF